MSKTQHNLQHIQYITGIPFPKIVIRDFTWPHFKKRGQGKVCLCSMFAHSYYFWKRYFSNVLCCTLCCVWYLLLISKAVTHHSRGMKILIIMNGIRLMGGSLLTWRQNCTHHSQEVLKCNFQNKISHRPPIRHYRVLPWVKGTLTSPESIAKVATRLASC